MYERSISYQKLGKKFFVGKKKGEKEKKRNETVWAIEELISVLNRSQYCSGFLNKLKEQMYQIHQPRDLQHISI